MEGFHIKENNGEFCITIDNVEITPYMNDVNDAIYEWEWFEKDNNSKPEHMRYIEYHTLAEISKIKNKLIDESKLHAI